MAGGDHADPQLHLAIDPTAILSPTAILGRPYRVLQNGTRMPSGPTTIGEHCYVGEYCVVGQGVTLGDRSIVDDYVKIEDDVRIGADSLLNYRATVCIGAQIGSSSVIGGFICEYSEIGEGSRVFGSLVHSYRNPALSWDDPSAQEGSPVLRRRSFVGFGAVVVGSVVLGEYSYVCAGAAVTRSVPDRHIAFATNQLVSFDEWKGPLRDSPFFLQP